MNQLKQSVRVTGLYQKVNKNNANIYVGGRMREENLNKALQLANQLGLENVEFVLMPNNHKETDKHPDYILILQERRKPEYAK